MLTAIQTCILQYPHQGVHRELRALQSRARAEKQQINNNKITRLYIIKNKKKNCKMYIHDKGTFYEYDKSIIITERRSDKSQGQLGQLMWILY